MAYNEKTFIKGMANIDDNFAEYFDNRDAIRSSPLIRQIIQQTHGFVNIDFTVDYIFP